jgi:hypothetical protein
MAKPVGKTREEWLRELLQGAKMPHEGHQYHLCYLHNTGFLQKNLEAYTELVKNPKFICTVCGRVAEKAENLCGPSKF